MRGKLAAGLGAFVVIGVVFSGSARAQSVMAQQQTASQSPGGTAQQIQPGTYAAMVFEWPVVINILSVDARGMLYGRLDGYPSGEGKFHGKLPTYTPFVTHVGPDGLPEIKSARNGNVYTGFHACGSNICVRFEHGGGTGRYYSGAWRDVVFVRR
jgi:hypothetical protein